MSKEKRISLIPQTPITSAKGNKQELLTMVDQGQVDDGPYKFKGRLSFKNLCQKERDDVIIKAVALDPDLWMDFMKDNFQYMDVEIAYNCVLFIEGAVSPV